MCLDGAGARQVSGLSEAGVGPLGLEGSADGEADGSIHGMDVRCSGCAEVGYCRRDLGQQPLASDCIGHGVQVEVQ